MEAPRESSFYPRLLSLGVFVLRFIQVVECSFLLIAQRHPTVWMYQSVPVLITDSYFCLFLKRIQKWHSLRRLKGPGSSHAES